MDEVGVSAGSGCGYRPSEGVLPGPPGFVEDVDVRPSPGIRVVQLTPPGSACSIVLSTGLPGIDMTPGTIRGLHLVVNDLDAARTECRPRRRGGRHRRFQRPRCAVRPVDGSRWQHLGVAGDVVAHWAVVLTYSPAGVYTDPLLAPKPCGANEKESRMAGIVVDSGPGQGTSNHPALGTPGIGGSAIPTDSCSVSAAIGHGGNVGHGQLDRRGSDIGVQM
jgi:hypothetical protein